MKKKPPDWFRQDIETEIAFMDADVRRKKEFIRPILEDKLKSMGVPKDTWQDLIEEVLKDFP